jgi:hypothetical protein
MILYLIYISFQMRKRNDDCNKKNMIRLAKAVFIGIIGNAGFILLIMAMITVSDYNFCKKCPSTYVDCGDLPQFCTNCTTCYGSNECFPYKECKFETNKFLIFLFVGIFSCCLGSCLALNFGEQQRQEKLKEEILSENNNEILYNNIEILSDNINSPLLNIKP